MFRLEREGKVLLCRGAKHRKGAVTNRGKSDSRNLGAESTRSRTESTGECVKLNAVTDITRNSARETFIADSVYFVLRSLWAWEPVLRLKKSSDDYGQFYAFSKRGEQQC